jgi:hypothetical protein
MQKIGAKHRKASVSCSNSPHCPAKYEASVCMLFLRATTWPADCFVCWKARHLHWRGGRRPIAGTGRLSLSRSHSRVVRVSFMHRISRMSNGNCGDRLLIQEAPLLIIEASANNDILYASSREQRRNSHRVQYLPILTTRTRVVCLTHDGCRN